MKNSYKNSSPLVDGYYLTDGGMETTLIFDEGLDLPYFASFTLLTNSDGRRALAAYYDRYLAIARHYGLNFVLETPTWRANPDWGKKLGFEGKALDEINRRAVAFMRDIRNTASTGAPHVAVSGNIGPRGDGYIARQTMTPAEAKAYHQLQVQAFAREEVDLVTAMTINYSDEAIGIVQAAEKENLPVVISFTVETDGRLPDGESLKAAIEKTDQSTGGYASYYMINCAHPTHFQAELAGDGDWKGRIEGIRANASTKSHAELDESETLDAGDKCQLAEGYNTLHRYLPGLKVIGGCCGTDHSHIETICQTLFPEPADRRLQTV